MNYDINRDDKAFKGSRWTGWFGLCTLLLFLLCILPAAKVRADATASAITFGTIDYEALTMQVFNNNNDIVYYSLDNSSWEELEAVYNSATSSYSMDISWVSTASDVILYFKGDDCRTVKSITLPMQNSSITVEYDKVDGDFTFSDIDDSDNFEWRKSSDYYWTIVNLKEASSSYQTFMHTTETFRMKGLKIMIRTPQTVGYGAANPGIRPSAEVTVSITARASAPSVKVNSSRMTINTSTSMEYYSILKKVWMECDSKMSLEDIAPRCLYENGSNSITLLIRKAETSSQPYSKTASITIPGQAAPPTIGGNSYDVTYYYLNGKLVMQFNHASIDSPYEYAVVKSGKPFSVAGVSWRKVSTSKLMRLSSSAAPNGCTIYIRKRGTDENTSKKISLVLASAVNSFLVEY